MKLEKAKKILKKGDLIDKIDYFRYFITIIICLSLVCIYKKGYMLSIRGAISDTIAFSSIILGILGLLIGLLMSLREDSIFFKKARKYDLDLEIYDKLLKRIRDAFLYNIVLVLLSIFYCFVIPNMPPFIKGMGLFLWFFLFIVVSWDVFYLIWIIVKICTFKDNDTTGRRSVS
ncbi:hypothetical protein IGI39_003046 [Enterococcus sp. AZ135]|uniref:hypothetical protein n=1 Tax=unclassified Enterococcus TaxID=2608891 RepID=UPI003F1E8084